MRSSRVFSPSRPLGALSSWPIEWANLLLQRQTRVARHALTLARQLSPETAVRLADALCSLRTSGVTVGFDFARAQYDAGVQAGLIERSLLASGAFERKLRRLEHLALGPLASSV
jgi:hypothetical protein